jgi:hypothetical protein
MSSSSSENKKSNDVVSKDEQDTRLKSSFETLSSGATTPSLLAKVAGGGIRKPLPPTHHHHHRATATTGVRKFSDALTAKCLTILELMRQHKMRGVQTAGPFLEPVDLTVFPDYVDVIAKPMDFATIEVRHGVLVLL